MSLVAKQFVFVQNIVKLLQFAIDSGYVITFGEAHRPLEMQQLYVKQGRSKTLRSKHMERLALDLNVFKDGKLQGREGIKPLGDYWESLHELNRWGGNWRGLVDAGKSKFIDAPHFEMQ